MVLFKLIFRNIFSHKLRSSIIFIVITLVVAILFLFLCFTDGEIENMSKAFSFSNPKTDIIVKQKGYSEAREANEKKEELLKRTIPEYSMVRDKIKNLRFVKNVYSISEKLEVSFILRGKKFKPIVYQGIEPGYSQYLENMVKIVDGHFIKNEEENVIIININLAKELGLNLGETITVAGNDLFGQAVTQDLSVIGFYMPKINNQYLNEFSFVDMKSFNLISGLYDGEATTLNIDIAGNYPINSAVRELSRTAADNSLNVEFHEYKKFYNKRPEIKIYESVRLIILFVVYIVIFIAMFGIMNVISVNLKDRKKEIGSYYCLGSEKYFLILMYSTEIIVVNIFSFISGISLGFLIRFLINSLELSSVNPGMQMVFGSDIFYLGYSLSTILYIFTGLIIVSILTSLATLGSSLKVSPSVAVREVDE
jgi:ABC-type lipoprotein release transport system permease subunit